MARAVFDTDRILDGARDLIVARGVRAATVDAIARATGAPVGSIYHRFRSIDELLARLWLRSARRLQETALAVEVDEDDPLAGAVAVALAMYDHCLAAPGDVLLLDALGREELLRRQDLGDARGELEGVNTAIEARMGELARALYGRAGRAQRDLVLLALVDLPHGFAHRQLTTGTPTPRRRERLAAAVRAVLAAPC